MVVTAANFSSSSIFSGFDLAEEAPGSPARAPEAQTNWLSRFLHIKPANKVLCFQVSRGKVRQDLVRLLRDWQRFGVRDVIYDRQTNIINARVDKNNRKYTQLLFRGWSLEGHVLRIRLEQLSRVCFCKVFFMHGGSAR